MDSNNSKNKYRISLSQKMSNKKQWYKDFADLLDSRRNVGFVDVHGINYRERVQVNYDLFNNVLNMEELSYVCKPFGENVEGEYPARMNNKDIVSPKIKAVIAMEKKLPFSFNVTAVNPEATTRKEQEEFGKIRDYVYAQLMGPIKKRIEEEQMQANLGRELTPEEQQEIATNIEAEVEAQTPESVRKYMIRDHQDPAEVMSTHLLKYLMQTLDIKKKLSDSFKHSLLSSAGVMYIGTIGDEVQAWTVNSKYFDCDQTSNNEFIEDGEWATCLYNMGPSKIVSLFGDELSTKDIDTIYDSWANNTAYDNENLFERIDRQKAQNNIDTGIPVLHCVWKALRKIGFLKYKDKYGNINTKLVDESYRLNKDFGDISIKWEYLPEVHETWKILASEHIYVCMRPLPGQLKDINTIKTTKLPYYGYRHDSLNSVPTALMDRLKVYQYLYNIFWYRLEILLASDKGKKLMMNIGSIPKTSGINLKQWQYFFDSTPFAWVNPKEEGTDQYADINTVAKVLDMSLASDIQKYINLLEYIRKIAGQSVGISDAIEGQSSPDQSVGLNQQNLAQSANILEPYFQAHAYMKRNVLTALLECGKIVYSNKKESLSYVLDDLSLQTFEVDGAILDASTFGLFITDSVEHKEVKDLIMQLSHAAMQNQTVEFSDIVAVAKHESLPEAEEELRLAEERRRKLNKELEDQKHQQNMEALNRQEELAIAQHEREKEKIILKEEERRKTVVQQYALTGMSFNPDADKDGDGINDYLEIANKGLDAEVKMSKEQLEREKFEYSKERDNKQDQLREREINLKEKSLNNKKQK